MKKCLAFLTSNRRSKYKKLKILITGSKGQLGSELKELLRTHSKIHAKFMDLPDLDICDSQEVGLFFKNHKINTVINCAAYTDVDKAEQDFEKAKKVNSTGVLNLVKSLEKVSGRLIHISTDYVFNGNQALPYKESDPVSPLGAYGKTKRSGEMAVINSKIDGIVIRTSWLYSSYGSNFVKTMMRLGSKRESLNVIFDQVGTPTYARDLAQLCLDILCSKSSASISNSGKIYHFSNEGVASWYDLAHSVMEFSDCNCKIMPIRTQDYPTLAKRPQYSVLDKTKIKKDFGFKIPYWSDSLKLCIARIKNVT